MYIDVKNTNPENSDLIHSYNPCSANDGKQQSSQFSRLQKMWKPLRKFIRFKTKSSKITLTNRRQIEFNSIPNNIYLNNSIMTATNNEQGISVNDSETANEVIQQFDDNYPDSYENIVEQLKAFEMKQIRETQEITENKQLITSATIEKVPSGDQCSSCIYGKNCQHKQALNWSNNSSPANLHSPQSPNAGDCLETQREADELNCWQDLFKDDKILRDWLAHNYQHISKYMPLPTPSTPSTSTTPLPPALPPH